MKIHEKVQKLDNGTETQDPKKSESREAGRELTE